MNALGQSADTEYRSPKTTNTLRESPNRPGNTAGSGNMSKNERITSDMTEESSMATKNQAGLTESHDLYRGAEQDSKYAHTPLDASRNKVIDTTPIQSPHETEKNIHINDNVKGQTSHGHRSDAEWQAAIDHLPTSSRSTIETGEFLPSKTTISSKPADFLSHAGNYYSSSDKNTSPSNIEQSSTSSGGGLVDKLEETYHNTKDKVFGAVDNVTHAFRSSDKDKDNDNRTMDERKQIQENDSGAKSLDSPRSNREMNNDREADTSRDNIDDKNNNSSSGFGSNLTKDFESAKETARKDYDIAKTKISDTYDAAKEKMHDLGGSFNKDKSDSTMKTNENLQYENADSLTGKFDNSRNLSNFSKDSAYVTSAGATTDATYITDANALEAGARLGNATEQMTEL